MRDSPHLALYPLSSHQPIVFPTNALFYIEGVLARRLFVMEQNFRI